MRRRQKRLAIAPGIRFPGPETALARTIASRDKESPLALRDFASCGAPMSRYDISITYNR